MGMRVNIAVKCGEVEYFRLPCRLIGVLHSSGTESASVACFPPRCLKIGKSVYGVGESRLFFFKSICLSTRLPLKQI